MAVYRDIDYDTRINGGLTVSSASIFSNNLTVVGKLIAGSITDVEAAINGKLSSGGGTVSGSLTVTGNLTVNGTISGIDLSQYYTKTNLQTSGQASVHWGNLTSVPTYDNYVQWKISDNTTTTNVGSQGTVKIIGGGATTVTNASGTLTVSTPQYIHPATHSADIITDGTNNKAYTAAEKTKLSNIADNANNYVHPATHPATMIADDALHRFVTDTQISNFTTAYTNSHAHGNSAVLEATQQSFTTLLKSKLDGISSGATKTEDSAINGNIKIDGAESVVYAHPATHSLDEITETSAKKIMTSAERTAISSLGSTYAAFTNANVFTAVQNAIKIKPSSEPSANHTDEMIVFDTDTKTLANNPADAMSETVMSASGGGGTLYTRDTDYTVNYTTGQITRKTTGAIASAATVYVSYRSTKVAISIVGSGADSNTYFSVDNRGNIFAKSMNVTLSTSTQSGSSEVPGDFVVQGNFSVKGNVVLGDAITDTISFKSGFTVYNNTTAKFAVDSNGQLTSGDIPWARLSSVPSATTLVAGIVQLSTSTNDTSTSTAATPSAVKAAYDLANGKWTYNVATIKAVKVDNAVNADTVNSLTVQTAVPLNALFTDTVYTHPNHTGDVTSTGDGNTTISANAVSNAKLRQSAALSIIGNPTNATANVTDIAAGSDGYVLRRSGTSIGFGTIATAGITDAAVTFAKMQHINSQIILGRNTASAGDIEELSASTVKTILSLNNVANTNIQNSWIQNSGQYIGTPRIRALDSGTLSLTDDAGNGITIIDGGNVGILTATPGTHALNVNGTFNASSIYVAGVQKDTNWDSAYTHIADAVKHITAAERTNWGTAYSHSQVAHAPSDAPSNATFTGHTGNTTIHITAGERTNWGSAYTHSQISTGNPHGTTKGDIALGNVENKSSATIRSEITSANVTTALGYTPLKNISDTLTGDLTINATGGGALTIKSSSTTTDHVYMQFYADAHATSTRSGWIGYGSTGTAHMTINNEMTNGDIVLAPNGTGKAKVGANEIYHAGNLSIANYALLSGALFTGAVTVGSAGTNANLTVNGQISASPSSGTTAPLIVSNSTLITNLNSDKLDSWELNDILNRIIDSGGYGVISGCKITGVPAGDRKFHIEAGRVLVKDAGIVDIADQDVTSAGGIALNEYTIVFIAGKTELGYTVKTICTIKNASSWPDMSAFTNPVILAKIRPTSGSTSVPVVDSCIYDARQFIPVRADARARIIKLFECGKDNITMATSSGMSISRLELNASASQTVMKITDQPDNSNITKQIILTGDKITLSSIQGTGSTTNTDIDTTSVTSWNNAGGKAHDHIYDAAYTGPTNNNTTFTLTSGVNLAATTIKPYVRVYKNGMRMREGATNDYTISTSSIVFNYSVEAADIIIIDYDVKG